MNAATTENEMHEMMMRGLFEDMARERGSKASSRDIEATIMDLRDYQSRHQTSKEKGVPFAVGDLVTPMTGYNVRNAGEPHIVLEVLPVAETGFRFDTMASTGSSDYGRRIDMRVGFIDEDGDRSAYWVESLSFETYAAANERKAAEAKTVLDAVKAA